MRCYGQCYELEYIHRPTWILCGCQIYSYILSIIYYIIITVIHLYHVIVSFLQCFTKFLQLLCFFVSFREWIIVPAPSINCCFVCLFWRTCRKKWTLMICWISQVMKSEHRNYRSHNPLLFLTPHASNQCFYPRWLTKAICQRAPKKLDNKMQKKCRK